MDASSIESASFSANKGVYKTNCGNLANAFLLNILAGKTSKREEETYFFERNTTPIYFHLSSAMAGKEVCLGTDLNSNSGSIVIVLRPLASC